jgi:competence protein ComEC
MRAWMLAFCSGVIVAGWSPQLPAWPWLGAALLLLPVLLLRPRLRLAAAALAGCCWLWLWGQLQLQQWLPAADYSTDLLVQGRIEDVPLPTERGWRVQLRLDALCAADGSHCEKLHPWQRRRLQVSILQALALAPGQHWQWQLRLRRPHGFANPGGFDYEAWLLQRGIAATGYLRDSVHNRQLAASSGRPWFQQLRHRLQQQLRDPALPPLLHAGFIEALGLGLQQDISDEQWQHFSRLGLNHLVVISGLHLALVSGALFRLGLALARCSPWLLLRCPAPRCAAVLALGGAWLYAGLAGFALPVQRALAMTAVYCCGPLLARQTSSRQSLQLALLLVLLLDPLAPQSPGFWLSFLAVAILLGCGQHSKAAQQAEEGTKDRASDVSMGAEADREDARGEGCSALARVWQRLCQALQLQLLLGLGLLPVMLVFFQQASMLAPLANLPAIPWIGLLVVPCCLLGLLLLPLSRELAAVPLQCADFLLDLFLHCVETLSKRWPGGLLTLPPLQPLPLLLTLAMAALLLAGRNRRWRLAGLALLPVLLLWPEPRPVPGALELTVLDVGQGLAVLLRTHSQTLLYDAGPRYSERFDAGDDLLLPALRRLGVRQLDTVIISHGDLDHAGGLPAVMAQFPQALYIGADTSVFGNTARQQLCRPQHWQLDGFDFRLLHPDHGRYNDNDSSCVLHVSGAAGSLLLPGDISRSIELQLLQQYPQLQADFVVAPHHGSKSSSSSAFLRRLQPRWVVYSSGYLNRFGHPAAEVRRRYALRGTTAYETAYSGAVHLQLHPAAAPLVQTQRALQPRFWHSAAPAATP